MVKKDNLKIITKNEKDVDVEVIGYKVSYFIFSLFTAMVFIYFVHRGFQPIDIITIPVLTLVIYFIMVYFAEIQSKKNKEQFITENYINHNESIPSIQDIMEQYQNDSSEEMNNESESTIMPAPVANNLNMQEESTPIPEESPMMPVMPEESSMMPVMPEESPMMPVMPEESPMMPSNNSKDFMDNKQKQIKEMNDRKNPNTNMKNEVDDSTQPININISYNNNRPLSINDFPSMKVGVDGMKKADENRFRFDTGLKQNNSNSGNTTNNSYVDNSQTENNTLNNINTKLDMLINSGNIDSGNNNLLVPSKKKQTASSVPPPVNDFTRNLALSDMNQAYYPQYLENPLNRDKNPMNIMNVLEESKSDKLKKIYNDKKNSDTIVDPEMWKKYFVGNESNTICGKDNAPCPVLLNNYWSEYKPVESED
jgi:hypothetical protein